MPPTPLRLSSAAVLLLAFVAALPGQTFNTADAELQPPSPARPGTLDVLQSQHDSEPPETYTLGPGDLLSIQLLEAEDSFRDPVRISTSGALHLPMAGRVPAAGLTLPELEARLVERFKTYVREPHVAVNIVEYRSRPVTVIGAVQTPGVRALSGEKTLLQVLSEAGGLLPEAGPAVQITRQIAWGPLPLPNARPDSSGQFSTADVSLHDVLAGNGAAQNLLIRPQDIISVPRAEMVYVVGAVRQASGFVLERRDSLSVLEVLSLAGGLAPKAAPQRAVILRPGEEEIGQRVQIAVNLKDILAGARRRPAAGRRRRALRALQRSQDRRREGCQCGDYDRHGTADLAAVRSNERWSGKPGGLDGGSGSSWPWSYGSCRWRGLFAVPAALCFGAIRRDESRRGKPGGSRHGCSCRASGVFSSSSSRVRDHFGWLRWTTPRFWYVQQGVATPCTRYTPRTS